MVSVQRGCILRDAGMGLNPWPQLELPLHAPPEPWGTRSTEGCFKNPLGPGWLLCNWKFLQWMKLQHA